MVSICVIEQQDDRQVIHCDGPPIKNVFHFKYLGTVFSADVQQGHDIKSRIGRLSHGAVSARRAEVFN